MSAQNLQNQHSALFSEAEYRNRIERTKARMLEEAIELLVLVAPENLNYLTGYAGWSFYTPQFLLLDLEDSVPTLLLRQMDVACAEFTTFLPPDAIIGYPEGLIGTDDSQMAAFLKNQLSERGRVSRVIGLEMTSYFFTPRCCDAIRRALPDSTINDAGSLVNWVRLVKSDVEITLMRQAGILAERAMETVLETIEPGVRECDVAAKVYATQIAGTPEFGGGVPAGLAISSGEKTRAPHLSWTDETFKVGQTVNIELGGCRHQYHCGLARSLQLGRPSPSLTSLADAVLDAMSAAQAIIRPGVPCYAIEAAWREVLNAAGYDKSSRIGYSIGLGYQPIWVEGTASFQRGDDTILAPNMVFHMICGMWHGIDNFVVSETIRVAETGFQSLTNFPKELFVK